MLLVVLHINKVQSLETINLNLLLGEKANLVVMRKLTRDWNGFGSLIKDSNGGFMGILDTQISLMLKFGFDARDPDLLG